jgi:hypothetical protein
MMNASSGSVSQNHGLDAVNRNWLIARHAKLISEPTVSTHRYRREYEYFSTSSGGVGRSP